jgi:predicted metal-binding protein
MLQYACSKRRLTKENRAAGSRPVSVRQSLIFFAGVQKINRTYSGELQEQRQMTDDDVILTLAVECGFDHISPLEMSALEFLPEVRQMCAADVCRAYNRNWTCPPACGSLEDVAAKTAGFQKGILVQTTAVLEDDFDYETMTQACRTQTLRFQALIAKAKARCPELLPMGAGGCKICETCTYPGNPCRFPDKAYPSMEAYGLFVSRVCEKSGMKYYYVAGTITYTCCILYN